MKSRRVTLITAFLVYLDISLIFITAAGALSHSIELHITGAERKEPKSISLELNLDSDFQNTEQRSIEMTENEAADEHSKQLLTRKNCPKGFIRYKSSCYHVVQPNGEMTWEIANTYCQLHKSQLVDIQSESEQMFIEQLVKNKQDNAVYWIGATNSKGKGQWEWTATSEPLRYTLWVSQWSSWAYEIASGSCALLDTSESGQWMFWPCQNNFYMGGSKHDKKTGIGIICEQKSTRWPRKIRHKKHRKRRRKKRKGRKAQFKRLFGKIIQKLQL